MIKSFTSAATAAPNATPITNRGGEIENVAAEYKLPEALQHIEVNPAARGQNRPHALARLDLATRPEQLELSCFRLHPLKGELAGSWSITVRANWRIILSDDMEQVKDDEDRDWNSE